MQATTASRAISASAIAIVITGGVFKGRLGLPIDLTTLATMVAVFAATASALLRQRVPRSVVFAVTPIALMALGLAGASYDGYGRHKAILYFTVTLAAVFSATVLARSREWARTLWVMLAIAGVVACVLSGPTSTGRVSVSTEGDPIGTARVIGTALLVLMSLILSRGRRAVVAVPAAAGCIVVMLSTGARAPLAAVALAVLMVGIATQPAKRSLRLCLVAAALIGGAWYGLASVSEETQQRLTTLESTTRSESIATAAQAVVRHPLGVGFGDFGSLRPALGVDYPHNLLLEATVEGGWIAGLGMLAWLTIVLVRAWRHAGRSHDHALILGLLVYWALNSIVSGDLNSNRPLLIFAGIAASSWSWTYDRASTSRVGAIAQGRPDTRTALATI